MLMFSVWGGLVQWSVVVDSCYFWCLEAFTFTKQSGEYVISKCQLFNNSQMPSSEFNEDNDAEHVISSGEF